MRDDIKEGLNVLATDLHIMQGRVSDLKNKVEFLSSGDHDQTITKDGLACRVVTEQRYQELVSKAARNAEKSKQVRSRLQEIANRLQDCDFNKTYRYIYGSGTGDRQVLADLADLIARLSGW